VNPQGMLGARGWQLAQYCNLSQRQEESLNEFDHINKAIYSK